MFLLAFSNWDMTHFFGHQDFNFGKYYWVKTDVPYYQIKLKIRVGGKSPIMIIWSSVVPFPNIPHKIVPSFCELGTGTGTVLVPVLITVPVLVIGVGQMSNFREGWNKCQNGQQKYISLLKIPSGTTNTRPALMHYVMCNWIWLGVNKNKTKQKTVHYSTVQYSTVQYSTVQYSTVQFITVQYSTVQYSTVQYSTVQYCTMQYSALCAAQYST